MGVPIVWLNKPCQELFAKDCTSKSPNVLTADDFQRETPADATDPFGQLLTLEAGLNRTCRAPERKTCFFFTPVQQRSSTKRSSHPSRQTNTQLKFESCHRPTP
jgi:hypothetical protein